MRANARDYQIVSPATLDGALAMLAEQPSRWTAFAGGTELMVQFSAGRLPQRHLLNLAELSELRAIEVQPGKLVLGGGCTFAQLRRHLVVTREFPLLAQTAGWIGGIANQNRATLAGNIANASPAADSPPALLVYEAEIELVSAQGARMMPYCDFHLDYKKTARRPEELIRAIHLPRRFAGWRSYARKVGTRNAQAISKVCIAAQALVEDGVVREARIAIGSVAPVPLRLRAIEEMVSGCSTTGIPLDRISAQLSALIRPIDDIRSTAAYRHQVAINLLRVALLELTHEPAIAAEARGAAKLAEWNALPEEEAIRAILPCCGSVRWAREMAAARPIHSEDDLLTRASSAWWKLSPEDWNEAFNTHPRIGEREAPAKASAQSGRWSSEEQSGVADDAPAQTALAEANRRYEAQFGRVFLICATGKSAQEMLIALELRLQSDEKTELQEAAEQQNQITALRLRKWLQ